MDSRNGQNSGSGSKDCHCTEERAFGLHAINLAWGNNRASGISGSDTLFGGVGVL